MHTLIYTFSENYNSFIWTPMKTASSHASHVFSHFDFITVLKNLNTGVIINQSSDFINFGHSLDFPPNHSNMSFICTIRNPTIEYFHYFQEDFYRRQKNQK